MKVIKSLYDAVKQRHDQIWLKLVVWISRWYAWTQRGTHDVCEMQLHAQPNYSRLLPSSGPPVNSWITSYFNYCSLVRLTVIWTVQAWMKECNVLFAGRLYSVRPAALRNDQACNLRIIIKYPCRTDWKGKEYNKDFVRLLRTMKIPLRDDSVGATTLTAGYHVIWMDGYFSKKRFHCRRKDILGWNLKLTACSVLILEKFRASRNNVIYMWD